MSCKSNQDRIVLIALTELKLCVLLTIAGLIILIASQSAGHCLASIDSLRALNTCMFQ